MDQRISIFGGHKVKYKMKWWKKLCDHYSRQIGKLMGRIQTVVCVLYSSLNVRGCWPGATLTQSSHSLSTSPTQSKQSLPQLFTSLFLLYYFELMMFALRLIVKKYYINTVLNSSDRNELPTKILVKSGKIIENG